jgi:pSer/pThr/pTyr-binding forkhead associated (FHA) protein
MKGPEFELINMKTNKRLPITYKQTVIGRNPNLMIHINDISVSSKHAEIKVTDDFKKAYLVDLGALNGCFINGSKLQAST